MSMRKSPYWNFWFLYGHVCDVYAMPRCKCACHKWWPELTLGIFLYYSPHIVYGGRVSCFYLLHAELYSKGLPTDPSLPSPSLFCVVLGIELLASHMLRKSWVFPCTSGWPQIGRSSCFLRLPLPPEC